MGVTYVMASLKIRRIQENTLHAPLFSVNASTHDSVILRSGATNGSQWRIFVELFGRALTNFGADVR